MSTIIVVGGGASGFFSAIHNKKRYPNHQVIILEKSTRLLSKVKVSGGGRCNVTHACFEPKDLCDYYPRGSRELRGPFHVFQPRDVMAWFESHGVPLKIESDNRVFPVSNRSQDICDCLLQTATDLGVTIQTQSGVRSINKENHKFVIELESGKTYFCEKLILATGSSSQGYALAKSLGHTIKSPVPSLFTFRIDDQRLHALSGLSVKDVIVWLWSQPKQSQTGPLLVTHWGMSGPSIIKLSAWQARRLYDVNYSERLGINWLPNYDKIEMNRVIQLYLKKHPHKTIDSQSPFTEIPRRLWRYLIHKAGIKGSQVWYTVGEKQWRDVIDELRQGTYQIAGKGVFKDEFVTCGGVVLKEVNFKTMESKCCEGLYLVGEVLDSDGVTGGFNFQQAWTTGFLSA